MPTRWWAKARSGTCLPTTRSSFCRSVMHCFTRRLCSIAKANSCKHLQMQRSHLNLHCHPRTRQIIASSHPSPLFKKSSSQFEDSFTSQRLILRRTQPCGLSIDSHEIHPPRPRPLHPRLLKRQLRHQKGLQLLLLLRKTCRRLLWQRRQVLQDRHARSLILLSSCDRPFKAHALPRALFFDPHVPLRAPPSRIPAIENVPSTESE